MSSDMRLVKIDNIVNSKKHMNKKKKMQLIFLGKNGRVWVIEVGSAAGILVRSAKKIIVLVLICYIWIMRERNVNNEL